MRTYTISTGRSRLEQEWQSKAVTWEVLEGLLSHCARTSETYDQFKSMSRTDKGRIKDVGGFVGGALRGAQRKACNMAYRSLVTLDIDYGQKDTIGLVRDMMGDTAWCLYSTHSHCAEAPRYRLIIPLDRDVTPDEYIPIARKLAEPIGLDLFDDSTYQPERLMFWPSASSDGEFVFEHNEGEEASADEILGYYKDWRDVTEWPTSSRIQKLSASRGAKQEDPTKKPGIIGLFCRAYTISEAISAFLSDVYEPTGRPDRYTYINGTTEAGAVVYDDKWLFSHHGTDPCCEREVNAFDLVRIQLFGDEDAGADPDTPVNKLPSYSKMEDFALGDNAVRKLQSIENFKAAEADFGAAPVEEKAEKAEGKKEDDDWITQLEWKQRKGRPDMLENTPRNFRLLLENLPEFKGAIVTDEFSHNRILLRDIPDHKVSDGKYWTDTDDRNLIQFFSNAPYFTQGKQNIIDTASYVASRHSFHPVREYLSHLQWDGKPRLETLVIDYLGAKDNELNRALTRKHFCAAVRRVFEPGCKHDGVLALDGKQGIGKSTLIKTMGGEWFSDTSISVDKTNETGMQLQGSWLLELAEMTDYKKSSVDAYKAFISSCEDKIRIPYDRSYQIFPRQCVIFATTNDRNFLKGNDGNRRFWIIPVGDVPPKKDVWHDLPGERDQIWAEAYAKYRTETSELGPLEQELYARQAGANELADDARVDKIRAYMLELVPQDWNKFPRADREEWKRFRTHRGLEVPEETLVQRPPVCYLEIAEECLGMRLDTYTQKNLRDLLEYVGATEAGTRRDAVYGAQRRWKLEEDEIC